ncbi:uncharacterized protein LOC126700770 [Quercus robur]|uniref:uncharacterized protein LOC126700770 n=1 Tax=Quercus robur TaxID=38942 RepID=UPI002162A9FE|nr:uncharacterized protein LOC126700770 [Quercus robur]
MVAASLKLLSEMKSASIPSNEHASTTRSNANSSSVRAKCDPTWDHVTEEDQEASNYSSLEDSPEFEDVQEITPRSRGFGRGQRSGPSSFPPRSNLGKRKVGDIGNYFAPRTTSGAQPSIKSVFAGKEKKWWIDMAIARWMYDACIPINVVNSSYSQPMFNAVTSYGIEYRGPNYYALRVPLLRDAKREVQLIVDSHRSYWADTGCTIMVDGWTDTRYRTLINFLVYCPKRITFIRSVDAFNLVKDAINLSNLFDEIVNWVGLANIVHLVTDNTANYVVARRILCGKYRDISWSPCAAHCLNLIFKEIGKMDYVAKLAKCASKITVFIYNDVALQAWLRTRKNWMEIVRLGPTRFATTFLALGSLKEYKHDLQALVTSKFYVDLRYAKDKKAKAVVKIILDNQFWNDCHDKKRLWEPYVNIIKDRWNNKFYRDIHAVAYWLNHAFQYDSSTLKKRLETQSAVTHVIELKVSVGRLKFVEELRLFREREQTFGTQLAQESAKTSQLDEWWRLFGSCAPTLQKFAIRILNQTAASSGLEDEESPFLDHEEIENAFYEKGAYPIEEWSSSHVQRVIEDDDDINLESFDDEDDAPPRFRDKNHPIHVEDEKYEDEDDDNDASGGAFGSHDDIDFNFLHNK